jgi:hypothetical protein
MGHRLRDTMNLFALAKSRTFSKEGLNIAEAFRWGIGGMETSLSSCFHSHKPIS